MKRMKKLASVLLALVMALCLAVPAFASSNSTDDAVDPGFSITINKSANMSLTGTYTAYKIFDVTYSGSNYSYTIAKEFEGFEYNGQSGDGLVDLVAGYTKDSTDLNSFAEAALKYATANNIAGATKEVTDETAGTVTINNLTAGYYLVAGSAKSADGQVVTAACSLDTTNPNAVITPKADAPSITKKIVDGDNRVDEITREIGKTVTFELKSRVPSMVGYEEYKYIVHDTFSSGLTLNESKESYKVTIGGTEVTDFTVTFNSEKTGFDLEITNFLQYAAQENAEIVITYSATVNENALTTGSEENTVNLEYSNNPNDTTSTEKTPNDTVKVYDVSVVITKVDGNENAGNAPLADAKFALYKLEGDQKSYYVYNNDTKSIDWTPMTGDTVPVAAILTTGSDGKLSAPFQGLAAGTYYLEEVEAPDGYNKLGEVYKIEITEFEHNEKGETTKHYTATVTGNGLDMKDTVVNGETQPVINATNGNVTFDVANKSGNELPETGGIGTTIFYVVGGVMVAAAGIVLVAKKRMKNQ